MGRAGGSAATKATVELHGKPLICYPLEAVRQVLSQVAILAKAGTQLPPLSGVDVWIEPESPRHPLVGITQALALAGGRPVLVCAGRPAVRDPGAGAPAGQGAIRAARRR